MSRWLSMFRASILRPLTTCGTGRSGGAPSSTVSGVVVSDATIAGRVFLRGFRDMPHALYSIERTEGVGENNA